MQSESTSSQETPTEDVVDRLEKLFSGPSPEDTPDADPSEEETPQSDDAEAAELPASQDDPDAQSEDEVSDETPAALPPTVKVKVDGQDIEVTLDEALRGYSRTADYTRKTQAHAEEVKKFQAEATAVRDARTRYDQGLQKIEAALGEVMGQEPDWDALRSSGQYSNEQINTAYINYQRQKEQLAAVQAEREKIARQQFAEQAENHKKVVAAEREKLLEALPDLKDDTKGTALRQKIAAFAQSRGYTLDDLNNTVDHRGILLLHDAMLYHELVAKQKQVSKKVDEQIRTAKPGVGSKGAPVKKSEEERARAKLAESGSIEDAADLLLARQRGR